jgi:DNA primase
MSHEGVYAKEYLEQRGIKNETITKFGLGFSLRANDALLNKFENEFKKEDLISSGLVIQANLNELRTVRGRLMSYNFESGDCRLRGEDYSIDNLEAKWSTHPKPRSHQARFCAG